MKKLICIAICALSFSTPVMAWQTDPRFPTFSVDGTQFMLTTQDDEMGMSVVLLMRNGTEWVSWGGDVGTRGIIMDGVTDAKILEKGSLRDFLVWCTQEAYIRAHLKATLLLPDPNNRIARLRYNMLMSVDNDVLTVAPAPLP